MAPNKDRASDLSDGHGIRCFADDGGNLSHIETGKPIASRSKTESPVKYRSDIDGLRALERLVERGTAGVLEVDRRLRDLVAAKGARYVSLYDAVCGHGPCETFAEGDVPLQFDAGHLTAEGSIKVARRRRSRPAVSRRVGRRYREGRQ
jgi:hypothetical protein